MEYFSLDRCVRSWDIDLNTRSLWRESIVVYTLIHIWWLSAPFEMVKSLYLGALYWTNIWIAPFWLNLSSLSVIDIQQLGLNMVSKFANHWDIGISLRTMMKNCLFIFILKFIYIYLYSSGLQEWFIPFINATVQTCFVWSTSDHTHQEKNQVCSNKTMNHSWSPELHFMNILCSSKSWALFEIHSPQGNRIYIFIYTLRVSCLRI